MDLQDRLEPTEYHFEHIFPTGPSISRILSHTGNTIVFDGYFRIEDTLPAEYPVRRLMYSKDRSFLIQVTNIKRGKDTSQYWYDEEEQGMICLTPTEIIELHYIVLESDLSNERYRELHVELFQGERDLRDKNEELYHIRMEKELTEWRKDKLKELMEVEDEGGV